MAIPILGAEEIETGKKGRPAKTEEEKAKDLEDAALEELLKEEKKKPKIETPIYVGPVAGRISTSTREHGHDKPITPEEPCCNKVCKELNNEIVNREESLGAVRIAGIRFGEPVYKAYPSIPYDIEVLKDFRYDLRDKGVCKCFEETGEAGSILPVIMGEPPKLISSKTGKPIRPAKGAPELPAEATRSVYRKDKAKSPTKDGCCKQTCNILTKEIDKMNKMLDKIELRGAKIADIRRNPRYEALAYKTYMLQQFRRNITKKDICDCIE